MPHNKMLIDATHPEETRVVVLRNGRVEEFDFESAARKLLRGNIYLAKVTRVEPSLQAAFIDYGGNRHGFLAFNEIHPDYYTIPVADRQALLEEEAAADAAKPRVSNVTCGGRTADKLLATGRPATIRVTIQVNRNQQTKTRPTLVQVMPIAKTARTTGAVPRSAITRNITPLM
jgi:Rne/Rng family ribonuclease